MSALASKMADQRASPNEDQTPGLRLPQSPFQRLATLLFDLDTKLEPIDLGVGEPRHAVPDFVGPILADNLPLFGKYPPIAGSSAFQASVCNWLGRRYGLADTTPQTLGVLPVNGSREGLFYALFEAREAKSVSATPLVFSPNPFYQTYAAAAEAATCRFLSTGPMGSELPDLHVLSQEELAQTIAVYVASPTNPQGRCATAHYWDGLIQVARAHDILIFADECYSELYRTTPPVGILERAEATGSFANVVSFNSLSKRSNLAGLRCGFMAGDPVFLKRLARFRNMAAPQVPLPVQAVAARAFADEDHVAQNRALYTEKFTLAEELLKPVLPFQTPEAGFFLWLDVSAFGDGETICKALWQDQGLRMVPGAYLTADEQGRNSGAGFIRAALVHDIATTRRALTRMADFFQNFTTTPG